MGNGRGASPFVKASTFFLPYGIASTCARVCVCMRVRVCVQACVVCACACVCVRVCVHARVKTSKNPPETQKNRPPLAKKKSFSI